MNGIEYGAATDRKDGRTHIRTSVSTCRVITRVNAEGLRVQRRQIIRTASPSEVTRENLCRWCAAEANLLRVEQANAHLGLLAVDAMLARIRPASTLSTAGYNPEYDAERAAIAADWAAQAAPVERRRTLAEMRAVNLRNLPQPTDSPRYVRVAA